MELFVGIAVLAVFAVLAGRFGCDSRDGIHSKDLARRGADLPRRPATPVQNLYASSNHRPAERASAAGSESP